MVDPTHSGNDRAGRGVARLWLRLARSTQRLNLWRSEGAPEQRSLILDTASPLLGTLRRGSHALAPNSTASRAVGSPRVFPAESSRAPLPSFHRIADVNGPNGAAFERNRA